MHRSLVLTVIGCCAAVCCAGYAQAEITLVRGGTAHAQIVTPDKPVPVVELAAQELQYHIRKATGAELAIVAESEAADAQQHHIYLGDCKATRAAGIGFPTLEPGEQYLRNERVGHVLRTIGDDLYLVGSDSDGNPGDRFGGTRHGTLFAVYEFLGTQMGVRWLWPGELGEVIPSRTDVVIGDLDVSGQERFAEAEYSIKYSTTQQKDRWQSPEHYEAFAAQQKQWLLRHRMGVRNSVTYSYGHYFDGAGYIDRFLKTRPDFFQLLPDGSRGYIPGMSGHVISMCISNPDLHAQMIADWKGYREAEELVRSGGKVGHGMGWMLNACENDTCASCACPGCRAWDASDPAFENHDYWSGGVLITDPAEGNVRYQAARPDARGRPAPSLSDRYARFYLELQRKAEQVASPAVVFGYAYSNYVKPPLQTKLNDRIVISMVPWPYFPWTDKAVEEMERTWEGWEATGARLVLRPNTMLTGHNFPIFLARRIGRVFAHHARHGTVATSFDSLTGQWASKGPELYVLTRMHARPEAPVEDVLAEYYAGFGTAAEAVQRYFEHWERVSDAAAANPPEDVRTNADDAAEGGGWAGWRDFARHAPYIFPPEAMAQGRELIEQARTAATGDPMAEQRVAFLEKGLTHAELTLAVARARAEHMADQADVDRYQAYARAMGKLVAYREQVVEPAGIANVGFLIDQEQRIGWDHSLRDDEATELADQWHSYFRERGYGQQREFSAFEQAAGGKRLDDGWRFRPDPKLQGIEGNWHSPELDDSDWAPIGVDSHWKDQPWGAQWRQEHGDDFQGVGWYRLEFTPAAEMLTNNRRVILFFGAVDTAAQVWVNSLLVAERPSNTDAWQEPFQVDITDALVREGANTLAVRVDHVAGAGGIWKPVWLLVIEPPPLLTANWGFEDSPAGQYVPHLPAGNSKNNPLSHLQPWLLTLAPGQESGAVAIIEGGAPEGNRYLRTVSFSPLLQRRVPTVRGLEYRISFRMRIDGTDLNALGVYWNDTRMVQPGTGDWQEYTLTVTGTGDDVLKFQRISGNGNPCLDAVSVEPLRP